MRCLIISFSFLLIVQCHIAKAQVPPLLEDNTDILDVPGESGVSPGWLDSYSADGACYCDTTFDHSIGEILLSINATNYKVRELCEMIGPGPGRANRPICNDIQCGNGPPNDAGDEKTCPGRVDHGIQGCGYIGPRWQLPDGGVAIPIDVFGSSSTSTIQLSFGIISWLLFVLYNV